MISLCARKWKNTSRHRETKMSMSIVTDRDREATDEIAGITDDDEKNDTTTLGERRLESQASSAFFSHTSLNLSEKGARCLRSLSISLSLSLSVTSEKGRDSTQSAFGKTGKQQHQQQLGIG